MEHSLAYMSEDVDREARRGDFLYAVLHTHAPHVINDIDAKLLTEYPRARHQILLDDETRERIVRINKQLNPDLSDGAGILS